METKKSENKEKRLNIPFDWTDQWTEEDKDWKSFQKRKVLVKNN